MLSTEMYLLRAEVYINVTYTSDFKDSIQKKKKYFGNNFYDDFMLK